MASPLVKYLIDSRDSLTLRECALLTGLAVTLPGFWQVEMDLDDVGNRTITLFEKSDSENSPILLIWREYEVLHLGLGVAETYLTLGAQGDIKMIADHIRRTLTRLSDVSQWMGTNL